MFRCHEKDACRDGWKANKGWGDVMAKFWSADVTGSLTVILQFFWLDMFAFIFATLVMDVSSPQDLCRAPRLRFVSSDWEVTDQSECGSSDRFSVQLCFEHFEVKFAWKVSVGDCLSIVCFESFEYCLVWRLGRKSGVSGWTLMTDGINPFFGRSTWCLDCSRADWFTQMLLFYQFVLIADTI